MRIFSRADGCWSKPRCPIWLRSLIPSVSRRAPPVEIDIDNIDESDGTRLIRRKTTRYLSHEQRAQIRFMYEKYQDGRGVETFLDDFESHVFFPRELRLLFSHTGFEVEEMLGDYRGKALRADSPVMIMIGRRSI
jgi:hypothetical protein